MRIAAADFSFPLLEHEQVLDLIAMFGVEGLDLAIMGNRSHVRPEAIRSDLSGWTRRLRERIAARGLSIADVFLIPWTDFERMAPNHPDADERAESRALFVDIAELAAALEAGGMTLLPGIQWPDETSDASFERAVEELAWRVHYAERIGLKISVEPHLGSLFDTPDKAVQLFERVPGLGCTLDYTHFVFQGIPESEIERMIPYARHFHARGAAPGRLQTTLRQNTIDYDRVVDLLEESGYEGYIGIEYVWTPGDPPGGPYDMTNTDNVAETILLRDKLRERMNR